LFRQATSRALACALDNAGKRSEARIAMIAMTTRSSINVNPDFWRYGHLARIALTSNPDYLKETMR
jgi:hypothetical protein